MTEITGMTSMQYSFTTTVHRVIYYNEETKWGVLALDNVLKNDPYFRDSEILATGNFRGVYEDCTIDIEGKQGHHPKYGVQLQILAVKVHKGVDRASVVNFLSKSDIAGIAENLANSIFNKFGEKSIDIVLNHTERLLEVKGIGQDTFNLVVESVGKYKRMEKLVKYATQLGIKYSLIDRLDKCYGDEALKVLKTDIYKVLDDCQGVFSFSQIDSIGEKLEIPKDSPKRLKACLNYCLLNRVLTNSSTGCVISELRQEFAKVSGLPDTRLFNATMATLVSQGIVLVEGTHVYLKSFYMMEERIAQILNALNRTPLLTKVKKYVVDEIADDMFSFDLNSQQKEALYNIPNERVSVLTGGPGTGKSTITKVLVHIFDRYNIKYKLLSPTGKATRRLSECTGKPAFTIHKFLGVTNSLDDAMVTSVDENTAIIVDEASMMDIMMLNKLLELALLSPIRLILIGDKDQLPSVQAGNVLGDLIDSNVVLVHRLTDIMRQSEDSHIIKYCHAINNGKIIQPCKHDDFVFREYEDTSELLNDLLDDFNYETHRYGLLQVQVITPYKKGELGMESLNREIARCCNDHEPNITFNYRLEDKVMQTINDYENNVFNGEVGIVQDFFGDSMSVRFQSSDSPIGYAVTQLNDLQLAYACTCHKSQGAEYNAVFVILDKEISNFLLTRKMLYTATSRGKKKVYIYGTPGCLNMCIKNVAEKPRITKLGCLMTSF